MSGTKHSTYTYIVPYLNYTLIIDKLEMQNNLHKFIFKKFNLNLKKVKEILRYPDLIIKLLKIIFLHGY